LQAILKDIQVNELELGGTIQPHSFTKGMILASVLKDVQGLGFLQLRKRLAKWSQPSNKAI
jgi:hypothetical protein